MSKASKKEGRDLGRTTGNSCVVKAPNSVEMHMTGIESGIGLGSKASSFSASRALHNTTVSASRSYRDVHCGNQTMSQLHQAFGQLHGEFS